MQNLANTFELKSDCEIKDMMFLQPALYVLLTRTFIFCSENNLPCKITSIISDRDDVVAQSKTHEQGRAVDISIRDWPENLINKYIYMMNIDYSDIAAISSSDNKPRAVIRHNVGSGDHLHLQVRHNANLNKYFGGN